MIYMQPDSFEDDVFLECFLNKLDESLSDKIKTYLKSFVQ